MDFFDQLLLFLGARKVAKILDSEVQRQQQLARELQRQAELEELRYQYNMLYVLHILEDYDTSPNVEGIVINQGFRSYQVMLAMEKAGLNPSRTSNHMTGCAVDIRCAGVEQAIRYMAILIDIADQKKQEFDELFLEKRGSVYWIHFAARPKDNRRKISFFMK